MCVRLIGYVRVSRVGGREGESFISPDVQKEKIAKHADLHGHSVVDVVVELDASGGRDDRPKFQETLERIERGETDGVIVARLDRFVRSVAGAVRALERIKDAQAMLVSVDDGWDTSTAMGKFGLHLSLALGELELDRVKETWAVAQERAIRRGVHFAPTPPFGYRRGAGGKLEPVAETAKLVGEVFRRRAGGESLTALAGFLNDADVGGPKGSIQWNAGAVKRLLQNRAYVGEAYYGSLAQPEAHPAIATQAEFEAAQWSRLAPSRLREPEGALLAGLLRCAGCRRAMQRTVAQPSSNGQPGSRDYRCRRHFTSGTCPSSGAARADAIEDFVVAAFFEALGPKGVLARAVADTAALDEARRLADEAERELTTWIETISVAEIGKEAFLGGLRTREAQLEDARRQMNEATAATGGAKIPHREELHAIWPDLDIGERRRILAGGIDCVFLRRGGRLPLERRVHICWRAGARGRATCPGRGVSAPIVPFLFPDQQPDTIGLTSA